MEPMFCVVNCVVIRTSLVIWDSEGLATYTGLRRVLVNSGSPRLYMKK